MSQEPDTVSGWPGGMYVASVVQNLIFNFLVGVDDQMRPYADLAEQVPSTDNGGAKFIGDGNAQQLQVTFKLRKDATWSDGTPFTSKDIRFTWDLMMNMDSGAAMDLERKYEKVETPDDNTVVFTFHSEKSARELAQQDPKTYEDFATQQGLIVDPLYLFGIANSWIYPQHILGPMVDNNPRSSAKVKDLFTKTDYARKPIGTGAYTLKEWTAGQRLVLEARDKYHRGAAKIKNVVFSIVPKSDTLIAQLKAQEIDVITQDALDVVHAPVLDAIPTAKASYIAGTAWEHIDLNHSNPILADKKVRQALAYGIDRNELTQKIFLGKTQPVNSVIMDWSWAHAKDVPVYNYDPKKAEALLEEAGWKKGADGVREKDGKKLTLKFQTTDAPVRMKVTPLVKDHLAKIGVTVNIEHMPAKAYFDSKTGPLATGTFELGQYAWVGGYDPGADSMYAYHSRNVPTPENNYAGGNFPRYKNPAVDKALEEGLATLDQGKRVQAYQTFQKQIMDDLATIPLFARPNTVAVSNRIANFKPGKSSIGETWNVHEWTFK